jgi:hypothetical protein
MFSLALHRHPHHVSHGAVLDGLPGPADLPLLGQVLLRFPGGPRGNLAVYCIGRTLVLRFAFLACRGLLFAVLEAGLFSALTSWCLGSRRISGIRPMASISRSSTQACNAIGSNLIRHRLMQTNGIFLLLVHWYNVATLVPRSFAASVLLIARSRFSSPRLVDGGQLARRVGRLSTDQENKTFFSSVPGFPPPLYVSPPTTRRTDVLDACGKGCTPSAPVGSHVTRPAGLMGNRQRPGEGHPECGWLLHAAVRRGPGRDLDRRGLDADFHPRGRRRDRCRCAVVVCGHYRARARNSGRRRLRRR